MTVSDLPHHVVPAARPASRLWMVVAQRPELVIAPVSLVLLLFGWEWSVTAFDVPSYILPPPSQIWTALVRGLNYGLNDRGGYWLHARVTLTQVLLGFFFGSG